MSLRPPAPRVPYSVAALIAAFTCLRLLLAALAPLTPEEAYYWTWSRFPDWSYFDHPPLASYLIGATTALLGASVFGIKSAAVLWSLGWNLLWARLANDMFGDRRLTFWSLLALNLTLLYEVYGFGPTPDGPLLFGWIGTVWAVWRLTQTQDGRWWFAAGAFMGLSWLGKYAGVLLLPVVGLYVLCVPALRPWLRRPQPYLAALLAVLLFAPVLWWNAQHGWVSLAFQSSRRLGEMGGLKPHYFLALLAGQFLLLTPYLFGLSLSALWRGAREGLRRRLPPAQLLLLLNALVPLLLFTAVSFRSNAKINWLIPAWWSLVLLGMHYALGREDAGKAGGEDKARGRAARWRTWGLASSGVMVGCAVVCLVVVAAVPGLPLPGSVDIWSGWRGAAGQVDRLVLAERAQGRAAFVFSPNYKISSLLWFYRPGQDQAYAQDILGRPALQYDFFPHTQDLVGATGFLVVSDQAQSRLDIAGVRPLFDTLERAEVLETGSAGGKATRRIEIWRGTGYHGRAAAAARTADTADTVSAEAP